MTNNAKTYEITLTSGMTETVEANSVEETSGRIKFVGHVEGISDGFTNDVIKSFRADLVETYRLVPRAEKNALVEGRTVYCFNQTDGTTKNVRADKIMHAAGTAEQPGRYSAVTTLDGNSTRTEFVIPENLVSSIERIGNMSDPAVTTAKD